MINLQIDDPYLGQFDPTVIEKAAEEVLRFRSVPKNAELTVVVQGDAELQELNRQFLGIDAPTDVLSFPADELDPDTGNQYLGDIIISLPKARAQAEASGHPVDAELQLLVVHGVLHLLGMDHTEPEEKKEMWNAQRAVLDRLQVKLSRYPD